MENGLRLVTASMPHTRSVCVCIFVGVGSRYEQSHQAGVSHFVEHLNFKGTQRRPTSREISEAIDNVGGLLNGSTDRELTVYWGKVASQHFPMLVDLLVDMLRHSRFDAGELERERRIITEELNMIYDSPRQRVGTLIDEVLWPDQPLGWDVAGTRETVESLSREALLAYRDSQYTPPNTVVSVAGAVAHEEVVKVVTEALGSWEPGPFQPWFPAQDGQTAPRLRLEPRKTEQAHLCLALPGLSSRHPDRYTLDLLNIILGEGMSSRLFMEIRERRGLAYDVYSSVDHFLDCGAVVTYAGVDPKRIEAAVEAILHEFDRLKEQIPEAEIIKAKELAKGRLLLSIEDSRNMAGWIGAQELLHGYIHTVDEVLAIIDALTAEGLYRVASQIMVREKLNLAVVGPYRSSRRFEDLLAP